MSYCRTTETISTKFGTKYPCVNIGEIKIVQMTGHAFKIFYFKSNLTWRKASLGERSSSLFKGMPKQFS